MISPREAGSHALSVLSRHAGGQRFHNAVRAAVHAKGSGCCPHRVFDKTGTLTKRTQAAGGGCGVVFNGMKKDRTARIAACLEEHTLHMANAVVHEAEARSRLVHGGTFKVDYIVAHGIATYGRQP